MNFATKLGRHRGQALLAASIALVCWPGTGHAVENIRNVIWDYSQEIAWTPRASQASVTFDADLTPLEAAFEITSFSLAVVRTAGQPEIFYRCTSGPMFRGAAGTTARFRVDIAMSCDLRYRDISIGVKSAIAQVMHPMIGAPMELSGQALRVAASSRLTLGLALMDQDGVASLESLPGDTFACLHDSDDPTANGTIGVYFDPAGTQCSGTIPAGGVGKVYVVAKVAGATASGIAGAEFRFEGMPRAWEAYSVPDPQILAIGDPFANGVAMGFVCRVAEAQAVHLYTVVVFAHEDVSDVRFEILMRSPPLSVPCPMLLACDEPAFTKYCVESVPCFVNARAPTPCDAPTAVEAASWSTVKALYR